MLETDDLVIHGDFGVPALAATPAARVPFLDARPLPAFGAAGAAQSGPLTEAYRVFAWPKESPLDGDRSLEVGPADPTASPFGWHDTNGAPGAELTVARGNNVHAYTDIDADNVADPGSDPDGGADLLFDFDIDFAQSPPTYRPAAVTNLFYWNNVVHDITYAYGFNEAAGNFQATNYSGFGLGNDYVRAEAQDGSGTNNVNFGTPSDGNRPRMQMFVWTHPRPNTVIISSGPASGEYEASRATFGPQCPAVGPITKPVVLVNDGARVRPRDQQPADRRTFRRELPEQRRADGRRLERLLRTGPHRKGDLQRAARTRDRQLRLVPAYHG